MMASGRLQACQEGIDVLHIHSEDVEDELLPGGPWSHAKVVEDKQTTAVAEADEGEASWNGLEQRPQDTVSHVNLNFGVLELPECSSGETRKYQKLAHNRRLQLYTLVGKRCTDESLFDPDTWQRIATVRPGCVPGKSPFRNWTNREVLQYLTESIQVTCSALLARKREPDCLDVNVRIYDHDRFGLWAEIMAVEDQQRALATTVCYLKAGYKQRISIPWKGMRIFRDSPTFPRGDVVKGENGGNETSHKPDPVRPHSEETQALSGQEGESNPPYQDNITQPAVTGEDGQDLLFVQPAEIAYGTMPCQALTYPQLAGVVNPAFTYYSSPVMGPLSPFMALPMQTGMGSSETPFATWLWSGGQEAINNEMQLLGPVRDMDWR